MEQPNERRGEVLVGFTVFARVERVLELDDEREVVTLRAVDVGGAVQRGWTGRHDPNARVDLTVGAPEARGLLKVGRLVSLAICSVDPVEVTLRPDPVAAAPHAPEIS